MICQNHNRFVRAGTCPLCVEEINTSRKRMREIRHNIYKLELDNKVLDEEIKELENENNFLNFYIETHPPKEKNLSNRL